uniref:hypothetical protein n=1 Tax=Nocardia farcinica TaxID=37329 RepID=UPI00245703E9
LPAWVFLAAILAALAPLTVGYRHEFHGECPTLCYTRQPVEGPTPHGLRVGGRWHRVARLVHRLAWVLITVAAVAVLVNWATGYGDRIAAVAFPLWLLVFGGELYADQRHTRSWCPICWRRRGWDDDDHTHIPDPDPSTAAHPH